MCNSVARRGSCNLLQYLSELSLPGTPGAGPFVSIPRHNMVLHSFSAYLPLPWRTRPALSCCLFPAAAFALWHFSCLFPVALFLLLLSMPKRILSSLKQLCFALGFSPDKVLFLVSDLVCLMGSVALAYLLRMLGSGFLIHPNTVQTVFCLLLFSPVLALALGLYNTTLLQPPHVVLYRIFCFVTGTFSLIFIVLFFSQTGLLHSRLVFLMAWALACIAVPLGRNFVSRLFSRREWWGAPLVFLNYTKAGRDMWHYLRRHPEKGFRPVAFAELDDLVQDRNTATFDELQKKFPGAVALIATGMKRLDKKTLSRVSSRFSRILLLPVATDEEPALHFLVSPYVLDTTTGFFLQQRLHDKRRLAIKRAMDLVLCALGSIVILPLIAVLVILIRLDSKGPAFYRQKRIGRGGREIFVHKFRTMVPNADALLKDCLAKDPELAAEWERDHKLKHDPRVTRVGHFLRKTSLDELPQLYDVLRGTMSLVGPRPIVEAEREKYGSVFNDYIRVRPGITGLWQISGRNDTSYSRRVDYDFYYVSNWNIWLDIWILARTVPVVLFGKGAY